MAQRTYTLEIAVDFGDLDKHEVAKKIMQQLGTRAFANMALLADGIKPKIAIFSDDFFSGHEDFVFLEDVVAKGDAELAEAGDTSEAPAISQDLLDAMKDNK